MVPHKASLMISPPLGDVGGGGRTISLVYYKITHWNRKDHIQHVPPQWILLSLPPDNVPWPRGRKKFDFTGENHGEKVFPIPKTKTTTTTSTDVCDGNTEKKTEQFHFNLQPCHVRCCRIVFAGLVLQDLSPPNEKCIPFPRNVPTEAPCCALHQDNHNSFISFLLRRRCLTSRC